MKRQIISLGLCLALLLCLFTVSAAAEEETYPFIEAYEQILNTWRAQLAADPGEYSTPELWYLLYDIDKDGSPELLVKAGTCEADYHGALYTFRDGRAFQFGEELGLGHSAFYSDPDENGLILMYGHMGYAQAVRISLTDGYAEELLYEDNLNARLQEDPDAEYVYPGDVIPGSVYLTLCRGDLTIGLTHYGEIMRRLEGAYPANTTPLDPQIDAAFYDSLMANNGEVFAVTGDGFTNSPGRLGFQELLKQDVAASWMQGDLRILWTDASVDLNRDGRLDCVLAVGDEGREMRIVLSEQDGTVYAYLLNYTEGYELDGDGNFNCTSEYYSYRCCLVFEREQAFLLTLPKA